MATYSLNKPPSRWHFLADLLDLVYPPHCLLCAKYVDRRQSAVLICDSCLVELFRDPFPFCPRCGETVGIGSKPTVDCVHCREKNYRFDSVIRVGPYNHLLREAILRMKYASGELLAESIGTFWANQSRAKLLALNPTAIVPIPLHFLRRWSRGYNQAAALATAIATALKLPCWENGLRRRRATDMHTAKSATARREAIRGAFCIRKAYPWKGASVLLVDDVMTTGATCNAAASVLKSAGCREVHVAVLARRSLPPGQSLW